jgi:hypothetical protein
MTLAFNRQLLSLGGFPQTAGAAARRFSRVDCAPHGGLPVRQPSSPVFRAARCLRRARLRCFRQRAPRSRPIVPAILARLAVSGSGSLPLIPFAAASDARSFVRQVARYGFARPLSALLDGAMSRPHGQRTHPQGREDRVHHRSGMERPQKCSKAGRFVRMSTETPPIRRNGVLCAKMASWVLLWRKMPTIGILGAAQ